MKWTVIALLFAVSPAIAAFAGTFLDNFNDGDLTGWHITHSVVPEDLRPNPVIVEDGFAVLDTIEKPNELPKGDHKWVLMELRTGNEKNWDSYTLTFRVRFLEAKGQRPPAHPLFDFFQIAVRSGGSGAELGHVGSHQMQIFPSDQEIDVWTSTPRGTVDRGDVDTLQIGQPIERNRWVKIKIRADKESFEFYYHNTLVTRYVDETALPGTVEFYVDSGMIVHLDDVKITGPKISFAQGSRLATTWGEIKLSERE